MSNPSKAIPRMHEGVAYALTAAALFGASTPLAKILVGHMAPVTLAGMLYLGSGFGMLLSFIGRSLFRAKANHRAVALSAADFPWLLGAIVAGGIGGPILLMIGLTATPASSASLLLNMEGVLTAALAWFVFKENYDRRVLVGMLLIVLAGALLSWEQIPVLGVPWGAMVILGACLCWAIDNNLTRKVSASDPLQIAAIKGLVAGTVNLSIAFGMGYRLPEAQSTLAAVAVGFFGYGLSLAAFVRALRQLGTARTSAYFSAAPFVGAVIALIVLDEPLGALFWAASALMASGIWLHITESHVHEHDHLSLEHAHEHSHDAHHQHEHDFAWNQQEPHAHGHHHVGLKHCHPHYPDIHHRHEH
jgi:drug/metabolite transporter (DMT)-like permease